MFNFDITSQPSSALKSEVQSILADAHARLDRYCKKWHQVNPSIPPEGDQWVKLFKALLEVAPLKGKVNIAKSICKTINGESEDKTFQDEAQLWRTHLLQACTPLNLFLTYVVRGSETTREDSSSTSNSDEASADYEPYKKSSQISAHA